MIKVKQKKQFFKIFNLKKELIDLIEKIFVWEPSKRITSNDALLHPLFMKHNLSPVFFFEQIEENKIGEALSYTINKFQNIN